MTTVPQGGTPLANFLNDDGTLRFFTWATGVQGSRHATLVLPNAPLDVKMAHTPATGRGLATNGNLGVDLIRLNAGEGFVPHTHPGDHLLIVVAGEGTITYDGRIYPTKAGQIYMVEGSVPHAVGAITTHMILAVGSPHKAVDSEERMVPVPYEEVTVDIGTLHCLLCNKAATVPDRLHDAGCPHCPCATCRPTE